MIPVLCFRVIEVIKTYLSPSHSHTGPTQHLSLMDMPRNYTEYHLLIKWTEAQWPEAQWLCGRMPDSGSREPGFEFSTYDGTVDGNSL